MALQRPLWLLHRRMELREQLEMKRDHLRRVKSWNEVIPTQRRQIEQAKESVVEVSVSQTLNMIIFSSGDRICLIGTLIDAQRSRANRQSNRPITSSDFRRNGPFSTCSPHPHSYCHP